MTANNEAAAIEALVDLFGPSGFEDLVRQHIASEIGPFADEVSLDALGNLIALKKGTGDGLKVMVAAHMDEIGLMVTHVTEEGFLRFTNVGALFPLHLLGARVFFADGTVGIIYSDRNSDRTKALPVESHFVDVGAKDKASCPVEVGQTAVFERSLVVQGSRLTSKAMDDRIGCYVAMETMRQIASSPHDIYFVFSVQEEVGTRGAQAAAGSIAPDVGLAIDVTTTGDLPESLPMQVSLGSGPAIKVKDSGMIAHTGLVRELRACAAQEDIPYQLEVLLAGSTDARAMQIAGPGCAAGCISIPCRYVHSQSETIDLEDAKNAVKLLAAFLSKPINL